MSSLKSSELTYDDYLKVPELLTLQVPKVEPTHSDELLFIIIHQAYELWFKLILSSMEEAMQSMEQKDVLRANHFMKRVVKIMHLLVQQIHILETMSPVEFLAFRDQLAPASGFQSIQFREVEFMAGIKDEAFLQYFKHRPDFLERLNKRLYSPDLRSSFYAMLRNMGFPLNEKLVELELKGDAQAREEAIRVLLPIYQNPNDHLALNLFSESLIEFDEYLGLWRIHHVKVVERIIGFKKGTGGSAGVGYLLSTTQKKCFPLLWELRSYLTKEVS